MSLFRKHPKPSLAALAVMAGALGVGGGLAVGDSNSGRAALAHDLVALDRNLSKVIDGAAAGKLSGASLGHAILNLEVEKRLLIDHNFSGVQLDGVDAAHVIDGFDGIDKLLERAYEQAFKLGGHSLAVEDLEKAKSVKQSLEKQFAAASTTTSTGTGTTCVICNSSGCTPCSH